MKINAKTLFVSILSVFIVISLMFSSAPISIPEVHALGGGLSGGGNKDFVDKCTTEAPSSLMSDLLKNSSNSEDEDYVPTNDRAFQFDQCMEALLERATEVALQNLKKELLNNLVDETIEWVTDEKEPKYVSNFNLFAKEILETAGGNTIREIGLANLYPGTGDNLFSAIKEGIKSRINPPKFSEMISYNNDEVDDIEEFKNDFKKGGFPALQRAVMPNNNPFGVAFMAGSYVRQVEQQEIAKQAATMSGQFKSDVACTEWVLVMKDDRSAGGVGDAYTENGREKYLYTDDPPLPKSEPPASNIPNTKYICREDSQSSGEIVKTPASTVGDIATKAITSSFDEVVHSDDIESYISEIADAAINRITKEGFLMFDSAFGYFIRGKGDASGYLTSKIISGLKEYGGYKSGETVRGEINIKVKQDLLNRVNKLISDSSSTMIEADEYQLSINSLETALFSTSSNKGLLECMKVMPLFSPPYSPPRLVGKPMRQLIQEMHDMVSKMRTDATSHKTSVRDNIYNPSLEARDRVLVISGSTLPQIINELKNNIKNLEDLFGEKLENFTNFKTDSDEIIDNVNKNRALCNLY